MKVKFWIHPKIQRLFLISRARHKVVHSGRGASKTLGAAACIIIYVLQNWGTPLRILCVRGTQNKLSESSLEALKTIIFMMGVEDYFDMTENTLKTRNENPTDFLFYGAKNPISFKSLEGIDICWVDEANELSNDAWEYLLPTIRKPLSQVWITFNPEYETDAVWLRFIVNSPPNTEIVALSYLDNPYFTRLPIYQDMLHDQNTNLALYNWKWLGEFRTNPEGALFKIEWFKYSTSPIYDKVIVALDPSGTSHDKSDACGIVVVAQRGNFYYILDDQTAVMSPGAWAAKSIQLYEKYKANYIVAETNFGADMIKTIIKQIEPSIPIRDVHASRGKLIRAEPIAALYEQGLVYHVKRFPELEYEMTTYTGDPKQKSPNRLDAAVWGVSSLMKGNVKVPSAVGIRF